MTSISTKNFKQSKTTRTFLDGSTRSVISIGSLRIGRSVYKPGWKWSLHAGPQTGKASERHIGYIVSGKMLVKGADGLEEVIGPGTAFEAAPGHDGWVVGDEPCVALDFEIIN